MTLTGNPELVNPGFNNPPHSPLCMLQKWLQEAEKLNINEPRSMVLATVDSLGKPSSRVVLLKDCDEKGVTFGTSQESSKGKDIKANRWAAGTLWWRETVQQINFRGQVTQLSNEQSDEMFQIRTRDAQAVSAISKQSALLTNEKELEDKILDLINSNQKIQRPDGWHAYHLAIESIEFWLGSKDRFHKRLCYSLVNGLWIHQNLQP